MHKIKVFSSLFNIKKAEWQNLLEDASPFCSYEFLGALEETGCIGENKGQVPLYFTLWEDDLRACFIVFVKSHSYGEYIFDWAWADAFARYQVPYYPKLCSQVPFTPVTDPKFLIHKDYKNKNYAEILLEHVFEVSKTLKTSSIHSLYIPEREKQYFAKKGFLLRKGHQYHFENNGYKNFSDFLKTLEKRKRKQIQKERNFIIKEANLQIKTYTGSDLDDSKAETWFEFYESTILKKRSFAYLNLEFFKSIFRDLSSQVLFVCAYFEDKPVAGSLFLYNDKVLYGRYWGAIKEFKFLHFELCYYQGIDFALSKGLKRFEAGAQGEHKIKRGFLPKVIWSAHYIENKSFKEAIEKFIEDEGKSLENFLDYVSQKEDPFKKE
ncbi:MAG: GNAT family N-acetyltransferase [Bdellovibrionota bacterium]|nr:GNAT family N-acetyltransferase [Bdellovibrionota bacterium]